jgi:hypothetical protein
VVELLEEESGGVQVVNAKPMKLREAIKCATIQLRNILGLDLSRIIEASRIEDGWHITVELIERKAVPDTQDLLGTYEVELDRYGDIMGYERVNMRRRMDLMEVVE